MDAISSVVIVGAGHGGFQTAKSLRDRGYAGTVTVVESSEAPPYQRPPLSKAYLNGKSSFEDLHFAERRFYEESEIRVLSGVRAESIDSKERVVRLSDGTALAYGHLVLATGTKPRMLSVVGAAAEGVHVLRTVGDADQIAERLIDSRNIVVIGGGFIGLEFVSVALARGHNPVVLEFADRIMGRAVSEPVSGYFLDHYRQQGADIRLDCGVAHIETSNGRVVAVVDSKGDRHPADLVIAGIGVLPETSLAASAGLDIDNGILVDEHLGTSDPHISAVGDCCSYPSQHAGRAVRLESVQNATDHGRAVAAKIVGAPRAYAELPWFWSDQGTKKLQIAGLNFGHDRQIVRGEPAQGKFSVFLYKGDELVAVDSVDRPMDHMAARRLLSAGASLAPEDAADSAFDLKGYALRAGAVAAASS
jgi:3-phenylpropionate/trans-cinnamate dioxygenase ferredoxin reductase subunit